MNGQLLRAAGAVLAIFLAASVTACAGSGGKPKRMACPAGQLCLEYGNGGDPTSLDPQLVTQVNEAQIMRTLFEGLYKDAANGDATPGLAQSTETSADGLTWTFKLRAAKWSDGRPVTARDFVYAYRRMLDPATASSYAYLLYLLQNGQAANENKAPLTSIGAEAPDDHTLVLHLIHAAPFLPQLLKHQAFYPVPEHVVRRWGTQWTQPAHLVTNGPYTLVDWRLGDFVRVQKSATYYAADKVCIDRVDYLPITDSVAAERRVFSGELDVSNTIQSSKVHFLRQDPATRDYVHTHVYLATTYVIFNTQRPQFKDRRVRDALSMAIDREFVTGQVMRAGQRPTLGFVPPGMAGYVPDAERPQPYWSRLTYPQRQAEARRLLAAAGYGPDHPLKFEFKMSNSVDSNLISQSIQADWASVGAQARLRQQEGQISNQDFKIRDFDTGLISWILDYDDPTTFLDLMKSDTGAQNYGDYKNPAFDRLLLQAQQEADGAKRAQLLRAAEQMIVDDADVAPVYNGVNRNLVNPRITGWADNFGDIHPVQYLCMKPTPAASGRTASVKP